jgi:hypothetical protein
MPSKDDVRAMARYYLQMADECTDPVAASLLRLLAGDYLEVANTESEPLFNSSSETTPNPLEA